MKWKKLLISGPVLGESEDESKINEIRKRMKGRLSGLHSSQSSDSISSGTSIHTVIYKGVKNKTNYFENIQTPVSNVTADTATDKSDEIAKLEAVKSNEQEQKTILEIKKDLETWKPPPISQKSITEDEDCIPVNLVKEIRKSFENMKLPEPPTEEELRQVTENIPPVVPKRSSSYRKPK